MRLEKYHWRHYFGGLALFLLFLQLLTGAFLTLYYQPHLLEAYASVQQFYKAGSGPGAWLRDSHRWIAFFFFFSLVLHVIRSLLRKDFFISDKHSRIVWLTGGFLLPLAGAILVTGFILPWEWKGYWFMEMVPNYFSQLPYVGPALKQFLIDAFTMNRNFAAHVLLLPVIAVVLLDFHVFAKLRKRKGGIHQYLLKHCVISVPFIIAAAVLAVYIPMPTSDPETVPMPLEGAKIPAPEWFFLIFMVPFMYFKNAMAPFLNLYLAFALYLALTFLPYLAKRSPEKAPRREPGGGAFFHEFRQLLGNILKLGFLRKLASFLTVFAAAGALFGFLYYETYKSPTLGCNSCHNTAMGSGIGVPPEHFKDRTREPKLDDNLFMVEHWFYPQVVW